MSKLTNMEATNLIYDLIAGMNNVEAGEKYSLHPRYVSLIRHKRRWKTLWDRIERSTTIAQAAKFRKTSRAQAIGVGENPLNRNGGILQDDDIVCSLR